MNQDLPKLFTFLEPFGMVTLPAVLLEAFVTVGQINLAILLSSTMLRQVSLANIP